MDKSAAPGAITASLAKNIIPFTTKGMLLAGAGAMGVGALGGLVGYGGYKQLQDSDNQIDAKLVEKKQYEDAIRELQRSIQEQNGNQYV